MKENEPKVKDSQKYWDNNKCTIKAFKAHVLHEDDKATYDRLVTLEAKIEEYTRLYKHNWILANNSELILLKEKAESELAELVKELKL